MTQAYDHLSEWFEYLNDDCDYPAWSQYFLSGLKALGAGRKGLEVGCGSGAFCRALARSGYEMTGVDLSLPMLDKAARLAREDGVNVRYLQADAARLCMHEKFDFMLAPNDCYNYIMPQQLPAAFRHAAANLKKGGVFWADVSSAYKLRTKVANNMFADDRDEVTYLAFSHLFADRVELDVTLFVRRRDGAFDRFDEKHTQYIHEEDMLVAALAGAGLEVLRVEGHLGGEKQNSDRLNFICRRL